MTSVSSNVKPRALSMTNEDPVGALVSLEGLSLGGQPTPSACSAARTFPPTDPLDLLLGFNRHYHLLCLPWQGESVAANRELLSQCAKTTKKTCFTLLSAPLTGTHPSLSTEMDLETREHICARLWGPLLLQKTAVTTGPTQKITQSGLEEGTRSTFNPWQLSPWLSELHLETWGEHPQR